MSIYPDWYSASFLSDCTNSALWGYYGDNHKGVCLKYRTKENDGKIEIDLDVIYGASGSSTQSFDLRGMRPQQFKKIDYHNKHIEIDFFKSLARMNKAQLNFFWYSDSKGNISNCADHFTNNESEDDWRDRYWNNYLSSFSVKLPEWAFEKEYRLIIHGDLNDYTQKEARKLKYDFNDLEGIIFGIKTHLDDKIRIIRIIENKCRINSRKDFKFYQAYYSKNTRKIETFELDLLKFE